MEPGGVPMEELEMTRRIGHMRRLATGSGVAVFLLVAACGPSSSSTIRDRNESAGAAGETDQEPGTGGSSRAGSSNSAGSSSGAGNANATGYSGEANHAGGSNRAGNANSAGSSTGGAGDGGSAGKPPLPEPNCEEGIAPTSQLRRLTGEQYDRTLRDLLGVMQLGDASRPSLLLAPDSQGTVLTAVESEAYRNAAAAIAEQVMADATMRARFLACTPAGAEDACWRDTIVTFGRRAFRRPLSEQEVTTFEQLTSEPGTVDEVAKALLSAFLVSPSFLFRTEIEGTPDARGNLTLSSYEIATRLSYMLWGSLPDETLARAADAGMLATKEQLLAQATRMLADARARDQVASFHRVYLRRSNWPSAEHDEAVFPRFQSGVGPSMLQEIERFFDSITFEDHGSFQDLLLSSRGFVNSDTAPIYGLDASDFGSELEEVALDPVQRPGFLTRIGFLSSFSSYSATSPIRRGAFVTYRLLGIEIAPGDPVAGPSTPLGEYLTQRESTFALTAAPVCAGCHQTYVDPPGFVLEAYDAIGAWQTQERATGAAIDTIADVIIDGVPVTVADPADLMRRIADSNEGQRTYAERWLSFAYEREPSPLDECTLDRLHYRIAQGNYAILDLLRDLTQTEAFGLRAPAAGSTQ